MKLPILTDTESLCDQCVGLCCRYYAFAIEKPKNKRDFEDIRWYLLHEDSIVFVEDGDWYIQVNRKCKELLPDNRCGIYFTRPTICREYTTKGCDWHGDEYDYDHLFTEQEQVAEFAKEFLAKQRARGNGSSKNGKAATKRRTPKRGGVPIERVEAARKKAAKK